MNNGTKPKVVDLESEPASDVELLAHMREAMRRGGMAEVLDVAERAVRLRVLAEVYDRMGHVARRGLGDGRQLVRQMIQDLG